MKFSSSKLFNLAALLMFVAAVFQIANNNIIIGACFLGAGTCFLAAGKNFKEKEAAENKQDQISEE